MTRLNLTNTDAALLLSVPNVAHDALEAWAASRGGHLVTTWLGVPDAEQASGGAGCPSCGCHAWFAWLDERDQFDDLFECVSCGACSTRRDYVLDRCAEARR